MIGTNIAHYNIDGLVKSLKRPFSVIPAQAGIQSFHVVRILWIPVFTGMTTFYEFIIYGIVKKACNLNILDKERVRCLFLRISEGMPNWHL